MSYVLEMWVGPVYNVGPIYHRLSLTQVQDTQVLPWLVTFDTGTCQWLLHTNRMGTGASLVRVSSTARGSGRENSVGASGSSWVEGFGVCLWSGAHGCLMKRLSCCGLKQCDQSQVRSAFVCAMSTLGNRSLGICHAIAAPDLSL